MTAAPRRPKVSKSRARRPAVHPVIEAMVRSMAQPAPSSPPTVTQRAPGNATQWIRRAGHSGLWLLRQAGGLALAITLVPAMTFAVPIAIAVAPIVPSMAPDLGESLAADALTRPMEPTIAPAGPILRAPHDPAASLAFDPIGFEQGSSDAAQPPEEAPDTAAPATIVELPLDPFGLDALQAATTPLKPAPGYALPMAAVAVPQPSASPVPDARPTTPGAATQATIATPAIIATPQSQAPAQPAAQGPATQVAAAPVPAPVALAGGPAAANARAAVATAAPRAIATAAVIADASSAATLAAMEQNVSLGKLGKDGRFDLNVSNAAPGAVFAAIVHDTRVSVLVEPNVRTPITVNLKDVTMREALEALSTLYGFEYRALGRRIVVQGPEMSTRVFKIDYPVISRAGRTEVRVLSGSITNGGGSGGSTGSTGAAPTPAGANGSPPGGGSSVAMESSRVTTAQRNDVWGELEATLKLLVPEKDGARIVVSPQTGTVVVRAMPREMREVEHYLEMAKLQVERQVMIEAKIIEVNLNDSQRAGVNWGAFRQALNSRLSVGTVTPGTSLSVKGELSSGGLSADPGASLSGAASLGGGLFGLAFQTSNFAAVLDFLETQGGVQVLSSPRIATLNNQKAVLKMGTDDFFVTNISTTTTSTGNNSVTSPTITVQPFFSGISLDVTPQIDDAGKIILHIHPQISSVKERQKVLNLGSAGNFTLPLASSTVNETDSIVRVSDGSIFAIGGLMREEQSNEHSGLPGTQGTFLRHIFGQSSRANSKQELVILLKPTVVTGTGNDSPKQDSLGRLLSWLEESRAATRKD